MFPALWILFTSLKTEAELTAKPITWFPHAPTLANYMQAFSDQPLHIFLFNSFMVALLSTCLTLFVSVLAAYALARLNLRYRGLILSAIIAVSTFPLVTLLVPLFEIMRTLNLLNTWIALVLPYTVLSLPVCTLMLVLSSKASPRSGKCSNDRWLHAHWRLVQGCCAIVRQASLPLVSLPSSMRGTEFLLALSFNSNPSLRTLPVGIQLYQGEFAFPGRSFPSPRRWHRACRHPHRDLPGTRCFGLTAGGIKG